QPEPQLPPPPANQPPGKRQRRVRLHRQVVHALLAADIQVDGIAAGDHHHLGAVGLAPGFGQARARRRHMPRLILHGQLLDHPGGQRSAHAMVPPSVLVPEGPNVSVLGLFGFGVRCKPLSAACTDTVTALFATKYPTTAAAMSFASVAKFCATSSFAFAGATST